MAGKYVLTGGPGAGKTTLIRSLAEQGFYTGAEVPRLLIQKLMQENSQDLPWLNRTAFETRVIIDKIADYQKSPSDRDCFFDRGMPDSIGYMRLDNAVVPSEMDAAARSYRYEVIFMLPPWEEIYVNDNERREDFQKAERIYGLLCGVYKDYGYEPIIVPKGSREERLEFIKSHI